MQACKQKIAAAPARKKALQLQPIPWAASTTSTLVATVQGSPDLAYPTPHLT
jgi:hypothetical protein